MPVSNPCSLHVVLHPKGNLVTDRIPCLIDLRRAHATGQPSWEVTLVPPCCCLSDLQAHFLQHFPSIQAYSAVYYQRLRDRPIAIQRHCVITVLGASPAEGLDTVLQDGTFAPFCFRGSSLSLVCRMMSLPHLLPPQ